MASAEDEKQKQFVLSTVDKLLEQGVFGRFDIRVHSVSIQSGPSAEKQTNFIARVAFVEITLEPSYEKISLIAKLQTSEHNDPPHAHLDVRAMFKNEVIAYREILPQLGAEELRLFPRFLFGETGARPESDIVLIDDIGPIGFRRGKDRFFKDKQIVSMVVRKIGEFHGLSYRAKLEKPEVADNFKSKLTMVKHPPSESAPRVHKYLAIKVIEDFINKNIAVDVLHQLKNVLNSVDFLMWRNWEPEEPTAAVTHGDLLSTNMFFKYTDSGVSDVKFFDLQTFFYGEPVMDLTFFLFINVDVSLLTAEWDHFIDEYWSGVTSVAPEPGFAFDTLQDHLARKCFAGFIESAFVLMFLAGVHGGDFEVSEMVKLNVDGMRDLLLKTGGVKVEEKLGSLLEFLIQRKYTDKFVESFASCF